MHTLLSISLSKISEIGATMSDSRAEMHKIRFPLGLRPDSAGNVYSAPPVLPVPAVFKGPTSKGRGGRKEGKGMGKGVEKKGWDEREGEWKGK